jgi:hypothetical protein
MYVVSQYAQDSKLYIVLAADSKLCVRRLTCNVNVRPTACHVIHLQLDISVNALDVNAAQSQKCIV